MVTTAAGMTEDRSRNGELNSSWAERVMLGLVLVVAALQFPLIFRINIGWDEFHFLSKIYEYHRGDLTNALQTFHVHLFRWLPRSGGNEIDQIIAARAVYYVLLLGTCGFMYLISRRFLTRAAGLFAVLLYLSYAEVIGFATTFRYDGLGLFLSMGALTLATRWPAVTASVVAAAGLAALSVIVTIKSLFYFPTLVLLLLIGAGGTKGSSNVVRAAAFVAVAVVSFATLYALHNAALPNATVGGSVALIRFIGPTGILLTDLFAQRGYLLRSMAVNVWTWVYLAAGVAGLLLVALRKRHLGREVLVPLVLLIPLASLAVYRNAFPYYYVFIMPAAAIVAAVPFDAIVRGGEKGSRVVAAAMVLVVLLGFGFHYRDHSRDETRAQRQLIEVVHRIFPYPAPYVDATSLIASFPKVGFFMSTWGMQRYRFTGEAVFEDLLLERRPLFVLTGGPIHIQDADTDNLSGGLLTDDLKVLRDNYIPHWGPIYVAGKELVVTDTDWTLTEILIPGPYTVEALEPVLLQSGVFTPGDVVTLEQGPVRIRSSAGSQKIKLRWGEKLYRPSERPVPEPVIRGFYPCGTFLAAC